MTDMGRSVVTLWTSSHLILMMPADGRSISSRLFSIFTIRPVIRSPFLSTMTAACAGLGMVRRNTVKRQRMKKLLVNE